MEQTIMKTFYHWKEQFQQENFLAIEKTIFWNLKTDRFYMWHKAKDIAVSILKVYLIFKFVDQDKKWKRLEFETKKEIEKSWLEFKTKKKKKPWIRDLKCRELFETKRGLYSK